jgi:hypothetical protein
MKVAVIGAGGMGGGIARLLVSRHEVAIGSRDPQRGTHWRRSSARRREAANAEAARDAEVVFLTLPWVAVDETLRQLGDLTGKVLVDVTNPYIGGGLQLHEDSSDAELIQEKAPSARVVKGWNTGFSSVLPGLRWPSGLGSPGRGRRGGEGDRRRASTRHGFRSGRLRPRSWARATLSACWGSWAPSGRATAGATGPSRCSTADQALCSGRAQGGRTWARRTPWAPARETTGGC